MLSLPALIRKLYGTFQASRQKGNALPALETSFNPIPNLKMLPENIQSAPWRKLLYFSFLFLVFTFSISIMPVPAIAKLILIIVLTYINLAPIFSQFFTNSLPILSWVFLFFTSRFIPLSMKRPISVKVLPALETIFYGDNLSEILASKTNTFLDIFTWLPYGIIHFSFPFIVAALIFLFAPPKTLPQFCWSFGFMNLTGVIVQNLVFSCAPPWYKVLHGLDKANYSMDGSPGGLARIDAILGIDMYTSGFTHSPLIFGAMPSLHSGCSTMDALWLSYLFPSLTPLFVVYVFWLWFSTMYLTHHYFIDVVVGSCLALGFFLMVKWRGKLPIKDQFCRWNYETLRFHDIHAEDPLKQTNFDADFDYALADDENRDLEYQSKNQIPLKDLPSSHAESSTDSSLENSFAAEAGNTPSARDYEDKKLKYEEREDLNMYDSDDEIAEANAIEKSANQSVKKTPKSYKESFEATIPGAGTVYSQNNASSSRLPQGQQGQQDQL